MKTALFVSYDYPPGMSVGSERVLKFRKYLPECGYRTCVLATRILGSLPDDRENRVFRAIEPAWIYRQVLRKLFPKKNLLDENVVAYGLSHGTFLQPLRDWLLEWVMVPDYQIIWFPGAIGLGLRLIKQESVSVIISTSSPETNHLVGMCLSKLTGIPHVADFRDGWMFEPLKPFLKKNAFRMKTDALLERSVVSHASAVITVSDPLTEYFRATYGLSPEQAVTITNGYDQSEWMGLEPAPRLHDKFQIVHPGRFGSTRYSPQPFLIGLAQVPREIRERMEVLLFGNVRPEENHMISELGIDDFVKVLPQIPRRQSLAHQLSADVLLLIVGTDKSLITSKLFEYLYTRRPILVIGSQDTAAARIVTQTQSGLIVAPNDPDASTKAVCDLFALWEKGALPSTERGGIDTYDRKYLAQRLATLLDTLC